MKKKPLPTLARVKELLHYDPETGIFTWNVDRAPLAKKGTKAGTRQGGKYNYATVTIDNVIYLAHRIAWLYMTGCDPVGLVDHINGDSTDNRFCNLRECTVQENQFNSKCRTHNKSGFKGVTTHKNGKFSARLQCGGMNFYLGFFDSPEKAHKAYCDAAQKIAGQFARTA